LSDTTIYEPQIRALLGTDRQGRPKKTGEWSEELVLLLEKQEEEEEEGEDEEGGGMRAVELMNNVGAPRTEGHLLMPASSREAFVDTTAAAMHPMYCICMRMTDTPPPRRKVLAELKERVEEFDPAIPPVGKPPVTPDPSTLNLTLHPQP